LAALPGNVVISSELTDSDNDSVANVTQLATVDRTTLEARVAALPDWLMEQVDAGLRRALALAAQA
jgi:mRNA interferase MazF